jgi:hypothetical protein
LKQVGLQLRILQRNNVAQSAVTADGSLDSALIARSHPSFDLKQVEMLVSEPAELRRLLKEAPETIIARTQPIATPDGKWLRVYSLADGSVHQRSSENPSEALDGKWQRAK